MDSKRTPVIKLDDSNDEITGTSSRDEVSVSSESAGKLADGLNRTMKRNEVFEKAWKEKMDKAPKLLRCNGCMRKFKNKMLIGKHWKAKNGKCKEELGFDMVSDVEKIEPDDISTPEERERASFMLKANQAAKKAAQDMNRVRTANIDRSIIAEDLMKYPMISLDRMLKNTSDQELKRFKGMKFDRMNSSRLHMAEKELEKRGTDQ